MDKPISNRRRELRHAIARPAEADWNRVESSYPKIWKNLSKHGENLTIILYTTDQASIADATGQSCAKVTKFFDN